MLDAGNAVSGLWRPVAKTHSPEFRLESLKCIRATPLTRPLLYLSKISDTSIPKQ